MISSKFSNIGHGGLFFAALIVIVMCFTAILARPKNQDYDFALLEISDLETLTIPAYIPTYIQDSVLMKSVNIYLNRYRPPHAFILLMDAESGDILAWGQRNDDQHSEEPTFLQRDSFPAASLAKIVTATAALENDSNSKSEVPKIGRNSTLYKRQIFPKEEDYKGSTITLEDAFAKSNNPAMGIIGINLGKNELQRAAEKLGFTNFNYPDSAYYLAESASGFTQRNTLSPLQIANAIRSLVFVQAPVHFKKQTYDEMRTLFLRTVSDGTAKTYMRKSVHNRNRDAFDIGGKTGSLDGNSPTGRYDWFAGFAQSKNDPKKGVIIVVMQVHGTMRNQHSSTIAGLLINEWAKR